MVVIAWSIGIVLLTVLNITTLWLDRGPGDAPRAAENFRLVWGIITFVGFASLVVLAIIKRAPIVMWVAFALGLAWSAFAIVANHVFIALCYMSV